MHSNDSTPDELQPELIALLRSLGGERAPAELAARVDLVRSERLTAPPELWQRVCADLRFGHHRTRVTRMVSWPRRLTVAAGILMLGGIAWLSWPDSSDPLAPSGGPIALAAEVPPERQRALRARLVVVEVPPERLSPSVRAFSDYFGGPVAMNSTTPPREEG